MTSLITSLMTLPDNVPNQVARMREGRPLASERFGTRLEAQDAATSAFVHALQLQPTNGQIWFDLGTSLFFAGDLP